VSLLLIGIVAIGLWILFVSPFYLLVYAVAERSDSEEVSS
jgi:hypothetical protein